MMILSLACERSKNFRQQSGNNPATKNQIATTIWIPGVIVIPRTTFHKQNCLRKALRDRVGVISEELQALYMKENC